MAGEAEITVREVAYKAGVTLEDLEKECCESDLHDFATLCDPWETIGRSLGLTGGQINAIREDNPTAENRRLKSLQTWRESRLSPTYRELIEAFLRRRKAQKALAICQTIKQRHGSSASAETQDVTSRKESGGLEKSKVPSTITASQADDDVRDNGPLRSKTAPPVTSSPQARELVSAETASTQLDFIRQKRLEKLLPNKTASTSHSDQKTVTLDLTPHEGATSEGLGASPLGGAAVMTNSPTKEMSSPNAGTFEVGVCVQVDSLPLYGVIRWIGTLPGTNAGLSAGIEMDDVVAEGNNGTFTDGKRYFTCCKGHGLFRPLKRLQIDHRFDDTLEEEPTTESSACVERSAETVDDHISGLMSTLRTGESTDHSSSLVFYIPGDQVGILVGKGGKNVQEVESETNTTIKVPRKRKGAKISENVMVTIIGSEENRKKALFLMLRRLKQRIEDRIATAETMTIPNPKLAGQIIGKKGSNKHIIEQMTGAKIRIENPETGSLEKERKCVIHGTAEQIAEAKEYIKYAMDGVDIATVANMTVLVQKLVGYFESIGFEFPNKFE